MPTWKALSGVALAIAAATSAHAACMTDAQAQDLVSQMLARTPATNPEGLSEADGAVLELDLGDVVDEGHGGIPVGRAG